MSLVLRQQAQQVSVNLWYSSLWKKVEITYTKNLQKYTVSLAQAHMELSVVKCVTTIFFPVFLVILIFSF